MLTQKSGIAGIALGALALCAILVVVHQDSIIDTVREDASTVVPETTTETNFEEVGKDAAAGSEDSSVSQDKIVDPSEDSLRNRIDKAVKVASKSLEDAHGTAAKNAAKAAVKEALADAGVVDSDNAGTVAWAGRNVAVAKKWAEKALKGDAEALGKVAAWTEGDRTEGKKMRRKCERAVQAMIAVASATKNKEMVAREAKLRQEGKMKNYDAAIKNAREASKYAGKSVQKARAALALTLGTKSRIAAKHALQRAQDALGDANQILVMETKKKDVITSNRLRATGAKLVGENEIHFRARKTFHEANRVLKLVEGAFEHARENHNAHKEAVMKREEKVTQEKATKLAEKERKAKSEAKRKALGIETKEEYAAYLAKEALKFGEVARDDAKKAAEAGKLAAEKAEESAKVKAELGVKNTTSTATVTEALERENIAADLATKAAKMEDAIVTGGEIPEQVLQLLSDNKGQMRTSLMSEARASSEDSHTSLQSDEDFHEFVTNRKKWMGHYQRVYAQNMEHLSAKEIQK